VKRNGPPAGADFSKQVELALFYDAKLDVSTRSSLS
jgi:hypothetical protein